MNVPVFGDDARPALSGDGDRGSSARPSLVGETVRSLCHDMQQPLTALRMLASELSEPAQEGLVAALQAEVDWLTTLVHSVLGPAAAAGPAETDLAELAQQVVAQAFTGAPCRHVVRSTGPVWAHVRAPGLRRALTCLLDNAIRAAGADGTVEVTVSECNGRAVIEVADDGPGLGLIPSQHALGLPTVRAVVADCGGAFTLSNRVGAGASAVMEVPLLTTALAS